MSDVTFMLCILLLKKAIECNRKLIALSKCSMSKPNYYNFTGSMAKHEFSLGSLNKRLTTISWRKGNLPFCVFLLKSSGVSAFSRRSSLRKIDIYLVGIVPFTATQCCSQGE